MQYKFRFSNKDNLTFNQEKSAPQSFGLWACFSALQLRVITVVLLTHLVWISYAVIWRGKTQCQPSYIRQSRVPHADHDWKYTWWILKSVFYFGQTQKPDQLACTHILKSIASLYNDTEKVFSIDADVLNGNDCFGSVWLSSLSPVIIWIALCLCLQWSSCASSGLGKDFCVVLISMRLFPCYLKV